MKRPVHFETLADDPGKLADFSREVFEWKIAAWDGPQACRLVTTGPEGTPGINGGIMARHFAQGVINTIAVESLVKTVAEMEQAGGKKVYGPHGIPEIGQHVYRAGPRATSSLSSSRLPDRPALVTRRQSRKPAKEAVCLVPCRKVLP